MGDLITPDTPGLLAVAFLIGIVVGLTGMGGGALMTPALNCWPSCTLPGACSSLRVPPK